MSLTFGFFMDAALTTPFSLLAVAQDVSHSLPPVSQRVFFGSPVTGKTLRAQSAPGVDDIALSVTSSGAGEPVSSIRLALTATGLASAVGGASIALGKSIAGGAANAVSVWVGITSQQTVAGQYDNLQLTTNDLVEM